MTFSPLTLSHWIFLPVFLVQVFVISYYFPSKIFQRMTHVLETYPPSEYPKLYIKSADYCRLWHSVYFWLNRLIMLLGLVVAAAVILLDPGGEDGVSDAWPAIYGMVQFVPLILLDVIGFRTFRSMRSATSHRKAELRPRRLSSYLSMGWVVAAVGMLACAVTLDYFYYDFEDWITRTGTLVFSNLFMGCFGAWVLYGRKPDPHQSFADRSKQIRAQLMSMFGTSIAISFLFMSLSINNILDADYLDAPFLSAYFTLLSVLGVGLLMRSMRLEDIDFEVYRADDPATDAA